LSFSPFILPALGGCGLTGFPVSDTIVTGLSVRVNRFFAFLIGFSVAILLSVFCTVCGQQHGLFYPCGPVGDMCAAPQAR